MLPAGCLQGAPSCRRVERPVQRVVRDLLPSVLTDCVVRSSGKLLQRGDRTRLCVLLGIGLVDRGGHDVINAAGDEQEWGAIVLLKVNLERRPGIQVAERALEQDASRTWDVVAVIYFRESSSVRVLQNA